MKKHVLLLLSFFCALTTFAVPQSPFELRDGDRVVFLGDTLMEREQYHSYIELALTTRFPKQNVTFRNLGWSGDTPEGVSRTGLSLLQAGYEPADEGWKQLQAQIALTKPTVVFLGYGMVNSFDGEKGLSKFIGDLGRVMDMVQQQAGKEAVRFVFLSPIRHENLGAPLPDPEKHNEQLALYTKAIEKLAADRNATFISLFDSMGIGKGKTSKPLTENGIHLNGQGYQVAAAAIEKGLGWKSTSKLDKKLAEALRQQILKKNVLFFNRSRPANMAYIFGFRKHEQGKNAVEIPQFDPLIAVEDANISKLLNGEKIEVVPEISTSKVIPAETNQSIPTFDVAPGFEVNLFAEDPQLAKPIHMNFDAQGRLWVASSEVYPQIEPGQKANDKILILEDTNNDGKSDKSTVFVDGLLIPTGVLPGDGGVYVGQSTELLFFKDTDGDGKSDSRKTILSGFGTEDTHHILHTLRWGMDGQMYFNQSIYIRADLETPNGVVRLRSGGVFNLRPPTMELEVFLRGFCNPWGHVFDEYGQSFLTDGAGSQGISFGLRDATYFTYAKTRRELKGISPGSYPKFCSIETIRSQNFPDDWQGNLITCDFRAHRVVRFVLEEQGAGFVTKEMPDLLRSTNATFRPIDVKMGPDGALYVADWSNPIIQHGEVDFRDPRRDHEHGRIWRITAKGRPLAPKPNLVKAKNSELLEQLLSPNDFNREQARRVLTERGEKIKSDLAAWTKKQTDEKALMQALWMYQSIDVVEPVLLEKVLAANDGRVRAAAVRVLSFWQGKIPNAEMLFAKLVKDSHPRVQLEAVRALAKNPSARSAELVLSVAEQPMDSFLEYGVWLSINDLAQPWLDAIQSGAWKPEGREKQLEYGLKAIEPALASTVLEKVLANRVLPKDGSGPWIELIGQSGGPNELRKLFDQALQNNFDVPAKARVLNVLSEAGRLRNVKPAGDLGALTTLLTSAGSEKVVAIQLAGVWKQNSYVAPLLKIAGAPSTRDNDRTSAFQSLREIGGKEIEGSLSSMAINGDASIQQDAATTLAALNLDMALPKISELLKNANDDSNANYLWHSILSIKNGGKKIATVLSKEKFPEAALKSGLKIAREGGRNEPELIAALNRAAGVEETDKTISPEEIKQFAKLAASKGDAYRGEKVFRRTELACVTCHSIGGVGGKVGPDMTSIGASAQIDYLVESILLPNAKIKEGFHSLQIQTKDEQSYVGIFVRETDQEIILRDAANKEVSIAKQNIESRANGMSLMPAGLVDTLSEQDRLDLFRFLSELGKPGDFDASKNNIARSWNFYVMTVERDQFGTERLAKGDLTVPGWTKFLTSVSGKITRSDFQETIAPLAGRSPLSFYAVAKLQLAKAGTVHLKLNAGASDSIELWIDGKNVNTKGEINLNLTEGSHAVVIKLDPKQLPETIKLETSEGSFLSE